MPLAILTDDRIWLDTVPDGYTINKNVVSDPKGRPWELEGAKSLEKVTPAQVAEHSRLTAPPRRPVPLPEEKNAPPREEESTEEAAVAYLHADGKVSADAPPAPKKKAAAKKAEPKKAAKKSSKKDKAKAKKPAKK